MRGAETGDHWHAAFGVYACGDFITIENTNDTRGIHTHGDGLIHLHPFEETAAEDNATLGQFFLTVGLDPANAAVEFGSCAGGAQMRPRLFVNGEEADASISQYVPQDGDVIVLSYAAPEEGTPPLPWADRVENPSDV